MRTPRIASQRAILLQAWRAAQQRSGEAAPIPMTPASAAGWLLVKHENSNVAHAMCPNEAWWDQVRSLLAVVVVEEGGAVVAPTGRNAS